MNTSCDTKSSFFNSCHPYLTIGCIISCFICTVVMIWGVYAMHVDMAQMENMMTLTSNDAMPMDESTTMSSEMMPPSSNNNDAMREHCKMMLEMAGCEKYR